jgi:2-hydroxy-6-oxonona-2,4-dienedioate hydrolase
MTGEPKGTLREARVRVGEHEIFTRLSEDPAASGPPVVLVHGYVISSRYMVPTAERLAPFHPVYAPDLPGFGESGRPRRVLDIPELADVLLQWMDVMGLERPVLVGNSMGCQILVDLASRHPRRVGCLVLVGPSVDPAGRSMPAQILRLMIDALRERPSLIGIFLHDFLKTGLPRAWRTARYVLADRVEDKMPRVQAPVLVVRGERDPLVPLAWAEEMTRRLSRERLVVIPGGPHGLNYSRPTELVREIRGFLATARW